MDAGAQAVSLRACSTQAERIDVWKASMGRIEVGGLSPPGHERISVGLFPGVWWRWSRFRGTGACRNVGLIVDVVTDYDGLSAKQGQQCMPRKVLDLLEETHNCCTE